MALLVPAANAQTMSDEQAIEAGRDALRGDFPWYDAESDQLQQLLETGEHVHFR